MSLSLAKKNIKHKRKTMKRKHGGGPGGRLTMSSFSFFGPSKKKPEKGFVGIETLLEKQAAAEQAAAEQAAEQAAAEQAAEQAAAAEKVATTIMSTSERAKTDKSAQKEAKAKEKAAEKEAKAKEKAAEKEAKEARTAATEARKEFVDAKNNLNEATETMNKMNKENDKNSNVTEWLNTRKSSTYQEAFSKQKAANTYAKTKKATAEELEAIATTKDAAWLEIKKKNGSNVDTKLTCPDNKTSEKVLDKLQKRHIKSFTAAESANALNFNAAEYDKAASMLERSNVVLELLAPMLPPGTTQIISVSKALVLGIQKYNKQQELAYLSSECLSFIANISRDLAEMSAFYNNPIVTTKEIHIDEALYEILVKNLFRFLYFLIDNIDFTNTNSGFYQYLFWYSFLSKIDFRKKDEEQNEKKEDTKKNNLKLFNFSYSCDECMPELLRKKLQEVSINGAPYKGLIDLKGVGSSNKKKTPKKNVSNTGEAVVDPKAVELTIGGGLSVNNLASSAKSAVTEASNLYMSARGRPEKDLYGFCGDDIVALCKNYNDIIMRLIEYNMYKLIVATYNNINFLPLIFKDVTNDEFFKYIFRNINIKDIDNEEIMEVDKIKEKVTDYTTTNPNTPATMCFDFLIHLKRIIEELDCENILPKTRPSYSKYSKGIGYARKGAKILTSFTSAYFGNPIVKYNTFLREYLIMTGNFATMISRYSLDHNRLSSSEKEEVVKSIEEKISKVDSGLKSIITQVAIINTELDRANAEGDMEGEGAEGEGAVGEEVDEYKQGQDRVTGRGGGKIIHNRPKKHSKKYKIYKKYKHSKKIKNKRKQKQYQY